MAGISRCNFLAVAPHGRGELCGTAEEGGPSHSRRIYEAALDPEKKLAWIKGGTHFMSGQVQQRETVHLIVSWLGERHLAWNRGLFAALYSLFERESAETPVDIPCKFAV